MTSNGSAGSGPGNDCFPGERRTTAGRFTGTGGRLVHLAPDGRVRDFGYPLTGLVGLERARIGLALGDDLVWPDRSRQRYLGDTVAVETVHETAHGRLVRHDVVDGMVHVTHARVEPAAGVSPDDLALAVDASFRPDGRDGRVGQLHLGDAVEVYHRTEHDFLAARPGFAEIRGRTAPEFHRDDRTEDHNEEDRLTGTVVGRVPFEDGAATVASLLTDGTETPRSAARSRLDGALATLDDPAAIRRAGAEGVPSTPADVPVEGLTADLRVLSLLSAANGLRAAGPDFDPGYRYSGGYGYTWFRDDAEIALSLLAADRHLGLDLDDWHSRSAERYVELQRADGSWPHRVWPHDGRLAPGWANGHVEDGSGVEYQADQTASVVAALAAYRDAGVTVEGLDDALRDGLGSLDATLADDGLPAVCQNAWEDATGRFTHTAATFLEAYSRAAATGVADGTAADRAAAVHDGLAALWVPERGCYGLALDGDGELDPRYDSATFALPAAHRAFDAVGDVGPRRLDRLVSHVETVIGGLHRETPGIEGLVRYEGDQWRRGDQHREKVWTVSTAWAADACAELSALLADHDDPRSASMARRATDLLSLVEPGGPLCEPTGYLPEQFFDDGTPDSATPLGWPHAIRTATAALLADRDLRAHPGDAAPDTSGDQ